MPLQGWNVNYFNSSFEPFVNGAFLSEKMNNSAPYKEEFIDYEFYSDFKDISYEFDEEVYLVWR